MNSQLILEKLNLRVRLGCSTEEQSSPQWVSVKIKLCFSRLPEGCFNDKLHDTLCYVALSDALQKFCDEHTFKLIEALTYQLYQFTRNKISEIKNEKIDISLYVTKNPNLSQLEQSSFLISDLSPHPNG